MYSICDLYHLYVQKKFKLNIVKTQLQEEDGGGGAHPMGFKYQEKFISLKEFS